MSALYYRNDRSQEELLSKSPYFEVKIAPCTTYFEVKVIKKTREAPEEHPKKVLSFKNRRRNRMKEWRKVTFMKSG